ncbi:MAG: sulfate transporter CysZ [Gammaproteobacteria bacterium]|nr:sulfate transporter CysZ [Gammaproteobacteria bacterium]
MISDTMTGSYMLARGFKLIKHPEVRMYVIVPLLINIILFGGLIWFGYSQFEPLVEWMMSWVPGFLDFLRWIIWLFITSMTAIIVFFTFTPIANLVAAPFNALMSEKIEQLLTGEKVNSDSSFMALVVSSIGSQLGKLVYILLWSAGLLLASLIPVINFISPVLWVIFGSWLLSLEYLDYPMGNHDLTFAKQKQLLAQRRGLSLGFGGMVMILTSIPVVNFFVMPIAVAGATAMWVDQLKGNPDNRISNP